MAFSRENVTPKVISGGESPPKTGSQGAADRRISMKHLTPPCWIGDETGYDRNMYPMPNEFCRDHFPQPFREAAPRVGLVLGSGLGGFVDRVMVRGAVSYSEIPGLPVSRVQGHAGRFVLGEIRGREILLAQGRAHLYEGWTAREAAAGARAMAALGIGTLILTNAAGIVNPGLRPGQWMQIADHLNFTGQSPLTGGAHFVDQTAVYSPRLRELFRKAAVEQGLDLAEGVYAWMPGPQYETPAEIRMLRALGADAVGMSTVPEAVQARALGLEVAGFSCLTNYGAGMTGDLLSHAEVMEMGRSAADGLADLLSATLDNL